MPVFIYIKKKTYGGASLSALSNPLKCAALRRAHGEAGGERRRHLPAQRSTEAEGKQNDSLTPHPTQADGGGGARRFLLDTEH